MAGTPHLVSDVMTRTVGAVRHRAAFKDVVRAMRQWHVSAVPVVDDEGLVVGVVSEADLLHKEALRDGDPDLPRAGHTPGAGPPYPPLRRLSDLSKAAAVEAGELMTAPAVTVHADTTLAQAARLMARHRVKRLPVVDAHGRLCGVVSRSDLLKVFLRDDVDIAEEIRRDILPRLTPDTDEPVRVDVRKGVVILRGRVRHAALVPVVTRLARAVEGVVDVDCGITGPATAPTSTSASDREAGQGPCGSATHREGAPDREINARP
jgi:CBS domain-containing protein